MQAISKPIVYFNAKLKPKILLSLLILVLYLYSATRVAAAKPADLEKYWERTQYLYANGSYYEAEVEAIKVVSKKQNRKSIGRNYINILLLQARAMQKQFRFKDASRIASKADAYIKILTKATMRQDANMMLCEYYLEEGNILAADQLFATNIADSLVNTPATSRIQGDAKLVKGSILTTMGYPKAAIPLLEEATAYFKTHLTGVQDNERYFSNKALNELAIKEKYAQSNYTLANALIKVGKLRDAEIALSALIAWANTNLPKDHCFNYRPYQALAALYEQEYAIDKAITAYTNAYTRNPHSDNEYEKQGSLLTLVMKNNSYGNRLEARNYIRRLEIKANTNIAAKRSAQLAYEISLCQVQFLDQSYSIALAHVARLERAFAFVAETHPYAQALLDMKKDVHYYQGNFKLYKQVLEKIAKIRGRSIGIQCPAFHCYKMEIALAEIYFGKDLIAATRIYNRSYHKCLINELEFASVANAKYLSGLADLFCRNFRYDSALVMQEKAVQANKDMLGERSIAYTHALSKLSEIQLMAGEYQAALASLSIAEKLSESKKGLTVENLAMQIQLVKSNRLLGNFAKSNGHMSNIKKEINAIAHLPFAYSQLAGAEQAALYFAEGIFYKAGKISATVRQETEAAGGNDMPWLPAAYETDAKVNIVSGNFANSTHALQTGLALSQDKSFDRSKWLLIQADYLIAISDYQEAMEAAKAADDIRRIAMGANHFYRYETIAKIAQIKSLMPNIAAIEIENLYKDAIAIISASLGG